MRRFVPFIVLVGLASCTYPSQEKALSACKDWESQEKELSHIKYIKEETAGWVHLPAVNENNTITARYCLQDRKSRKFSGYENNKIQNENWKNTKGEKGEWKIVKSFHY